MKPRVFITRRLPETARETLEQHFEVEASDRNEPLPPTELKRLPGEYDGVLATVSEHFGRELLHNNGRLRAISNYAAGLDNIDLDAARRAGVAVYNTPDTVTAATADLTLTLMLAAARRLVEADEFVRLGGWRRWDPELLLGFNLEGKTLGIIGFGRIGRAVARRALGFGMRVIFNSRTSVAPDDDLQRAEPVSRERLLKEADVVSLHVPLNPDTIRMLDTAAFAAMERRPLLLNMARGAVVDTAALVEALHSGLLRGAALDVTDPEPLPDGHPLLTMDNVIVTPHLGTATVECRREMARAAAENLVRHFGRN